MRFKYILLTILMALSLMLCMSSCSSSPKRIKTYKVILNNGNEYTVKATGFYTHHKYDSVQTVFWGGAGSFFNVSAIVEVYE